jgi:Phosphopantetheinyl transferase component of siderophore synthetase
MANAVPARRRAFAAGRACSRAALARLGVAAGSLLPDADRIPRWPAGAVGSISHTEDACAAAVAKSCEFLSLGLDLEARRWLPAEVERRVCTADELGESARLSEAKPWTTAIFGAKECFYKCYFPVVRRFLDFSDVHVALDPERSTFSATLVGDGLPGIDGQRSFEGRLVWTEDLVMCGISLARCT